MVRHEGMRRRDFLQTGALAAAGAALTAVGVDPTCAAEKVRCSSPTAARLGWRVGVAQYTFRRFSLFEMLDMLVELGIEYVELGFFLPLDKARPKLQSNEKLPPPVRKELKQRLADRGLAMSGFYADLKADQDEARRIFEFCKEMGAGTVIAEPPPEAFDMIEKLCDEYGVNVAIHNHPESPHSRYWRPENVLAVCKGRSKRIGACCDTGHWVRSGLDPVECLKKLEGRILGFHLKDVAEKGNRQSRDVPLGQGAGNYTQVMAEIKRQGYQGVTAIEYEHDSPELMADVAKCVAFVEQMAQKLSA